MSVGLPFGCPGVFAEFFQIHHLGRRVGFSQRVHVAFGKTRKLVDDFDDTLPCRLGVHKNMMQLDADILFGQHILGSASA